MVCGDLYNTVVSWVSTHGRLNIILARMGAYTRDINCIRLYGGCYIAPLKCGTWALAQVTTVVCIYFDYFDVSIVLYTYVHMHSKQS